MGIPANPSPPPLPCLYSQELQLKLYQAFIVCIPILSSIILLLLFYLFYVKRRVSTLSSPPPPLLPTTSGDTPTSSQKSLKDELKSKLVLVPFDKDLASKDSQCCVCLGEFEMEEELNQVPSCKHVFHVDCIAPWLRSNSTCPLCRVSISIRIPIP